MPLDASYYPCFTIRESECAALKQLAEPTKDRLFPMVRVQAWPRAKAGAGTPVARSLHHLLDAFGGRMVGLDIAMPRTDLDTPWALQGVGEIEGLHSPQNGFAAWCGLNANVPYAVPTVIWNADAVAMQTQVLNLMALGRGVVLRLRRSQNWNLAEINHLAGLNFGNAPLILLFDHEQIQANEDLTLVGLLSQNAVLTANNVLNGGDRTFVFAGSSFPSQFAVINPEYALLDIRERQLHTMLATSPPIIQANIDFKYGDHASVFAADREPSFRGAPRVDYPTSASWVYHRCPAGFHVAVDRVRNDPLWNEELLCWGAQRIRTAAGGNMAGLNAQGPWVTIRLNIHMHLQAHRNDGGTIPVEEEWED